MHGQHLFFYFFYLLLSHSYIHLHPTPLQSPDHKVLVLSLLHMSIAVCVAQLHPYINVLLWRMVPLTAQCAVSLVQQLCHFLSGNRVWLAIGIFAEQASSYVQVVLGCSRVFALWLWNRRLIVMLASEVLLGLADAWVVLGVGVSVASPWVWAFPVLVEVGAWCTVIRATILETKFNHIKCTFQPQMTKNYFLLHKRSLDTRHTGYIPSSCSSDHYTVTLIRIDCSCHNCTPQNLTLMTVGGSYSSCSNCSHFGRFGTRTTSIDWSQSGC